MQALSPMLRDERRARIEAVLDRRISSLTVVLEDLYDPRNGAAVLRSAEALGVTDVHAVVYKRFSLNHGVTMGSHKWVNLYRHRSVAAAAQAVRARGMRLYAAVPGAARSILDLELDQPLALWFGNEKDGLTAEALAVCDETVSIPMHGFTQSFNLSVSVALCLQALLERRRQALRGAGDLAVEERARLRARWYLQSVRGARQIVDRLVSKPTQRCVSEHVALSSKQSKSR